MTAAPRTAFRHALASLYDWLDSRLGADTSVLSDAEVAFLDGATNTNAGTGKAMILGTAGAVTIAGAISAAATATLADSANIVAGTTTGSKIGTAVTQKLGFWNATPVVQPVGSTQAAVAVSTITTASTTTTPAGYATTTQADNLAASVKNAVVLVNQLRADLVTVGVIKGAA